MVICLSSRMGKDILHKRFIRLGRVFEAWEEMAMLIMKKASGQLKKRATAMAIYFCVTLA